MGSESLDAVGYSVWTASIKGDGPRGAVAQLVMMDNEARSKIYVGSFVAVFRMGCLISRLLKYIIVLSNSSSPQRTQKNP